VKTPSIHAVGPSKRQNDPHSVFPDFAGDLAAVWIPVRPVASESLPTLGNPATPGPHCPRAVGFAGSRWTADAAVCLSTASTRGMGSRTPSPSRCPARRSSTAFSTVAGLTGSSHRRQALGLPPLSAVLGSGEYVGLETLHTIGTLPGTHSDLLFLDSASISSPQLRVV